MILNGCEWRPDSQVDVDTPTLNPITDDGTIISGLQAMDPWHADLGYPNATQIGLLNACGNFSGFVVGPIITWIDEKYGRKWGIRCECSSGSESRSLV